MRNDEKRLLISPFTLIFTCPSQPHRTLDCSDATVYFVFIERTCTNTHMCYKANAHTFRKYREILSPCSHGLTQPLDVLQSSTRFAFTLADPLAVDILVVGGAGNWPIRRIVYVRNWSGFFRSNLLNASTKTKTASYIKAACAYGKYIFQWQFNRKQNAQPTKKPPNKREKKRWR